VRSTVSAASGARHRANSAAALFMASLPGAGLGGRRSAAGLRLGLELLLPGSALGQVSGPVEKDLAVDDRFFHPRVGAEGVSVEDGQIRVLARLEGPHPIVDA